MTLTIYGMALSPPTRTVIITSKSLGLPYEFKMVNIFKGEHKKPEFLKLNPLHTVPAIDDNGTVLFDSHAIVAYLAAKYAKDDTLYPKDLVKKAVVDQRLHFDNGTLFSRLREHVFVILRGDGVLTAEVKSQTTIALQQLELLLGDSDWIANTPKYTVADISLLSTLENIESFHPYLQNHPKLAAWRDKGRAEIPGFTELTAEGVAEFKRLSGK